jgi:hypothetical protein
MIVATTITALMPIRARTYGFRDQRIALILLLFAAGNDCRELCKSWALAGQRAEAPATPWRDSGTAFRAHRIERCTQSPGEFLRIVICMKYRRGRQDSLAVTQFRPLFLL